MYQSTIFRNHRCVKCNNGEKPCAQEHPNKGVVVAVGPELAATEMAPGPVKPGDVVTFGRFNAEPIDIDGETYQLVRFTDIKLVESVTYAIN